MEFSRQEYWNGLPFLLQGIFPIQGSNPHVLHCWQILYCLSHQASLAEIKCVLTNCLKKITLGTFVVVQWLRFGVINEVKWLSRVRLCDPMDSATPWTVAYQAPPMGFSRQEWILEWVAISFSRGSFPPRDRTQVSCIIGRCFTVWASREVWILLLVGGTISRMLQLRPGAAK